MILRPTESWLRTLFRLHGSTLERTWPRILATTLVSIGVTAAERSYGVHWQSLTTTPFLLIGVALSILLGFRNSASYDRWWEGRKLWGGLVNITRSFARQIAVYLDADDAAGNGRWRGDLRREVVVRTIAYVHALRHHLRDTNPSEDLARLLSPAALAELTGRRNVPIALLEGTGLRLREAFRNGRLTAYHLAALEASLTEMTDLQGGCERIKNTPMPYSYTVLMHRLVAFYCFTLPFGILESVGWLTPVVVLLISHAFYGLDALGGEIEEPFGMHLNDLALDAICRTIEIDLLQSLSEADVPAPLTPVDGVLT